MTEIQNSKQYNLEERTLNFAKNVRLFVKKLSKTISNFEDGECVELRKIFGAILEKSK